VDEKEAALRAIPLDTALEILRTIKENKGIPVAANHVNPLAAAYQSLGYVEQARDILQNMLSNRTAGEEPEDGVDILNVHDLCAKDKGSYSLLVEGAVGSGDWGAAVEALGDMTRVGLYPNSRHYNSWNEISERHRTRSWKKKRDDFWVNSVR
jgi:pentatricopeptide repeat protein